MPEWLIIVLALAMVGLLVRREWRAHHTNLPGPSEPVASDSSRAGELHTEQVELCPACLMDDHCDGDVWWCDCTCGLTEEWYDEPDEDDDWAARLHEINLAVSHKVWSWFQQKMVPVSEVTHYEVEALIRTLAVPEWVPDRYRMAA